MIVYTGTPAALGRLRQEVYKFVEVKIELSVRVLSSMCKALGFIPRTVSTKVVTPQWSHPPCVVVSHVMLIRCSRTHLASDHYIRIVRLTHLYLNVGFPKVG